MPVYVGILLDSGTCENCSDFWKRYFLVRLGEDSLFYRRSINCFPDSRIRCRGPWPGALCSMVSLSARRDCDPIRDSPNGSDQSETTPKAKTIQLNKNRERNEFFNAFLIGVTFSFGWTPCVGPVLSSVLAIAASGGDGALQRRSPDAGLYIRIGAPLLSLGSSF